MFSEQERKELAKTIVEEIKSLDVCPNGMDKETVQTLKEIIPEMKEFLILYRKGKLSIWFGFWGFVLLGIFLSFFVGVIDRIKVYFE